MINPAPDRSHHEATEDGSDICGNVQYFRDYKDLNRNLRPRPILGRVKGIGDFWTPHLDAFYPIFGQHEPSIYENPLTPALAPIFLLLPSSFNRGME